MKKLDRLDELIDGAEELLTRLADAHSPEIQRLRDRVDRAIADARRTLGKEGDEASVQIRDIVNAIDDIVRGHPWIAVTMGMLIAGTFAFIAGTAAGANGPRAAGIDRG